MTSVLLTKRRKFLAGYNKPFGEIIVDLFGKLTT